MNELNKYSDKMVHKPWGFEYLFYSNDEVAIWCLHINKGASTSLHCHPNKKTGLIMLEGEAVLSFLNDTTAMKPLDRHILRPGLFHSTTAITDSILLEIETPPNKEDIVRFDDKYGRKGKPIEGVKEMSPLPNHYPRIETDPDTVVNAHCNIGFCEIGVWWAVNFGIIDEKVVIAVLKGGLLANQELIVSPGDVGCMSSFMRLAKSFNVHEETRLMTVCALQP